MQEMWNDLHEDENIYVVGAARNVNGLDTLVNFSSLHSLTFPLSPKDELGKTYPLFNADFVAISKDRAITGTLDNVTSPGELREFIQLAIDVMDGGIYVSGSFNNSILSQQQSVFELSEIISGGAGSTIEYMLESNSNPAAITADIEDDRLIIGKGSEMGSAELFLTALVPGKNEVEYKFSVINPMMRLYDDFEATLPAAWETSGEEIWFIDDELSFSGFSSLRSGNIEHSQSSELSREMESNTDSDITFSYKVSSEPDYDIFRFYIDDELILEESGDIDWTTVTYPVTAGNHTFKWTYQKDNVVTIGHNGVFIDAVIFPIDKTSSISEQNIAESTTLLQNYPNPFNPSTTIKFSNANLTRVKLSVFNVKGEMVAVLINKELSAGNHSVEFKGDNLNSGVYYYQLETEGKSFTRKMMLVK